MSGWGGSGGGGGFRSESGVDPRVGLRALVDRVDKGHRAALVAIAVASVRETKIELSKPGTGRVYLRQTIHAEAGGRVRNVNTGRFASKKNLLRIDKLGHVRNVASGRFVSKTGKNRHVASAPGQPPAPDTGTLRNSIGWEREDTSGSVRVGTAIAYAPYLEFGTPRMLARPFLATAIARVRAQYPALVATALRRATDSRR